MITSQNNFTKNDYELVRMILRYRLRSNDELTVQDWSRIGVNAISTTLSNIKSAKDNNGRDISGGPDFISQCNSVTIGIEHFRYDSYRHNRKGSHLENQLNNICNKICDQNHCICDMTIDNSASGENLYKSFMKALKRHAKKIPKYLENLKQIRPNSKKYEIWFFTEDATPKGNNYAINDHTRSCILPLNKELIDFLEEQDEKNCWFNIWLL